MTNREAFVTSLAVLGATFDRKLTAEAVEGYWIVLSSLSEDDFKLGLRRALETCRFMPSPAELLACARPPRSAVIEASLAWDAVRRANRKISWTVSQIDFGPHVNAVIRQMGGWDAICRAEVDDLDVWKRKEFERLYVEFSGKPIGDMGRALEGPADGKSYAARTIAIEGIPSQPAPALEPVGASNITPLIAGIAKAKS